MAKIIRLTAKNGAVKEIPFVGKFKLDPQFLGAKVEVIDSVTGTWVSAVKVRVRGKNVDLSYSQDAQPQGAKPEGAAESQSSSDLGSKDGSKSSDLDTDDTEDDGAAVLPSGSIPGTIIALGAVWLGGLVAFVASNGGSDKTPPPAPTALDLAAADDTGSSNSDNVTSQTSALTISGQAEANARVELFDGTTSLGTTTANASGAFSLDVTLAAGARSITARATDAAGNVGAASAALAITVDATGPAAPTGLDLASADDTGSSNSDNVTSQSSGLTITGQADADARVELFDGTTSLGTTTANASGAFSLDVTLAAGARSITARATDAAGNVGAASAALAITVDATAPAAPTGLDLAAADDSGTDNADNVTSQSSGLTITGQADADARVELFDGTTSLGTTTANASGAFSLDVTLAAGARSITARATDAAGNVGAASAALAITVDATAPAAPTGLDLAAADDSGTDNADNVTNQTSALTISGQAEANARVELFDGTTSLGTAIADATGAFSLDVTLAAGARSITARATDAAGNVGAASAALAITVDATAPAAPTGLDLIITDDTGDSSTDNLTNKQSVTITGTADVGSTVELFDGTTSLGTTTADASGAFSLDVTPPAAGVRSITAKATDAAGNVGAASDALAVTVDTTAPATPTGLDLSATDDTGSSNSDNVTSQKSALTISGQAEANASVELFDGTTSLGKITASDSGAFSLDVTPPAAGARSITAKATDAAGNESAASQALAITLVPAAPTGLDLSAEDDTGSSDSDNITSQTRGLTITGRAEPNVSVEFFDGTTSLGNAFITTDQGSFFINLTLAVGERSITAKATDAEGNVSAASEALVITVGSAAPAAPTGLDLAEEDDGGFDSATKADSITKQTSALTISGQADANALVELFDDTTSLGTTTANASGAFSLDVTPPAAGVRSITARATDAAGNVSVASAPLAITVDTAAPAAPNGLDLAAADDSGTDNADNITKQTSALTISGQADANALVELFDGTTSLGTAIADASGAFSLDVTPPAAGVRSITAKATDAAGNVGAASDALAVTVDTTAPATPTGLDLSATDDTGSSNSDNVTSQKSALTISGQAEANASVELFDGTTSLGKITASDSGAFSLDVTPPAAGARSITAKATDAAGNESAASQALAITLVPAAPTGLDLSAEDDNGSSNSDNSTSQTSGLTIGGRAGPNVSVELFDGTTSLGNAIITSPIAGSFFLNVTLAPGAHSITAKATDAEGNVSEASVPLVITVIIDPIGISDIANGTDILSGTAGNDMIFGGLGNDVNTTNGGNDWLAGGLGADTFVIGDGPGTTRTLDFGEGDTLDFSAFGLSSVPTFAQSGSGDTLIALDADTFVIVEGYRPAQLSDFLTNTPSSSIVL
jgi:hypothetical protein